MKGTVDLTVFRKKLARAKRQKEPPAPCSHIEKKEIRMTEGLRYLVQNIFEPLCRGEQVSTADLDFSRFERQDLWELNDFYHYKCFQYGCDWQKLKTLFDACVAAVPKTRQTGENGYV